jgi:hypothetical protein
MQVKVDFGSSHFSWQSAPSIAGEVTVSDDSNCSFHQLTKIVCDQRINLTSEKYLKVAQHFVSSSQFASRLMPKEVLRANFQKIDLIINQTFAAEENQYYCQQWLQLFEFLQSMQRAKVNKNALEKLMQQRDSETSKALRSFLPDETGFANKVTYNLSDSLTGRAKVASGPMILTAHQDVRKCIESSYKGGQILSVDFRSIEPRVALLFAEINAPDDVYSDLLDEFPGIDRQAAKLATLVALYGGRVNRLAEVLGDLERARKSVSFVRAHFRVDNLERKLAEQAEKGVVRNILGRPLREATKNPRIRTNHFLQSSAAELASLLFAELCSKFQAGIRPLFVIHDALIVDVHPDVLQKFEQEANSITWNQNRMPVKIERLSPI